MIVEKYSHAPFSPGCAREDQAQNWGHVSTLPFGTNVQGNVLVNLPFAFEHNPEGHQIVELVASVATPILFEYFLVYGLSTSSNNGED